MREGISYVVAYAPTCLSFFLFFFARQRNFGHAFPAFTECIGGHYSLDLNRELDREAATRLSEWSHLDQMCLRHANNELYRACFVTAGNFQ